MLVDATLRRFDPFMTLGQHEHQQVKHHFMTKSGMLIECFLNTYINMTIPVKM